MSPDDASVGEPPAGGDASDTPASEGAASEGVDGDRVAASGGAPAGDAGWFALAVVVLGAVTVLGVGVVLEVSIAAYATDFGVGFAWLLAATYVGFRVEGSPRMRLLGAGAFVVAAVAQFVSLVAPNAILDATSLLGIVVGGIALLVLVRRSSRGERHSESD